MTLKTKAAFNAQSCCMAASTDLVEPKFSSSSSSTGPRPCTQLLQELFLQLPYAAQTKKLIPNEFCSGV